MSKAAPKPDSVPKLPEALNRKFYKTGQTRGADDDEIFQNRVGRNSTVLIPYRCWGTCNPANSGWKYENGFIVLISPGEYFDNPKIDADLTSADLQLGKNALVFYETRQDWTAHNPDKLKWTAATQRTDPLGGQYVARIPATTASEEGEKIVRGFNATRMKGAGIRVYEYASLETIKQCRCQLEALFWLCRDSETVAVKNGMSAKDAKARKDAVLKSCEELGLLDTRRLAKARILNANGVTVCPLCLEEVSSQGFFDRMEQAQGRLVPDLTVTQLNLFHIEELHIDAQNHCPYNLGWGHHHCNVVVKDSGIAETLDWMRAVLDRNDEGQRPLANKTG